MDKINREKFVYIEDEVNLLECQECGQVYDDKHSILVYEGEYSDQELICSCGSKDFYPSTYNEGTHCSNCNHIFEMYENKYETSRGEVITLCEECFNEL